MSLFQKVASARQSRCSWEEVIFVVDFTPCDYVVSSQETHVGFLAIKLAPRLEDQSICHPGAKFYYGHRVQEVFLNRR